MGKSSIQALPTDHIERFSQGIEQWSQVEEIPKAKLIERFKQFGLDDHEIEMIFDRFYDDLTFTQIVKKRGWVSVNTASYSYRRLLAKLRRRGFSFK